jgi:hypothetical protein
MINNVSTVAVSITTASDFDFDFVHQFGTLKTLKPVPPESDAPIETRCNVPLAISSKSIGVSPDVVLPSICIASDSVCSVLPDDPATVRCIDTVAGVAFPVDRPGAIVNVDAPLFAPLPLVACSL